MTSDPAAVSPVPGLRARLARWIESPPVRRAIMAVILFNAGLLGLETSPRVMAAAGPLILALDRICLAIFVAELAVKLCAFGGRFFRSGWNLFDAFVVGVSLAPAGQGLSVLRALRVLRVLRLISIAPSLRRVVDGFVRALPGMGSVFLLILLIFYVGSVMATKLFAATHPEWFGSIGASAYTLFQIMTLESWSMGIVRPVMEVHPFAWAFFLPFILVTTFAVLNLLVGLVVNAMQEAASEESAAAEDRWREEVIERLRAIERRMETRQGTEES
ncbi:Ion transport protein [Rubellimicrobium thermophilum DSM 16684]|uniref:Ion transport protein n=1 Tax=Rubellimicrobium thermophilum DSM 16684 TaxID=1123069 RepID=S9SD40_9RHOB|nr:ion transporter [Rubellimicrobium thermophilum]EPX84129.1 Ion transport protein [Rubellimicrobium thermophilum DSM 16684]